MALSYVVNLPCSFLPILFYMDPDADNKFRSDIIFEIKYMIYCLLAKGTIVDYCWVPSHYGLFGNDRIATYGALRKHPLSY